MTGFGLRNFRLLCALRVLGGCEKRRSVALFGPYPVQYLLSAGSQQFLGKLFGGG
jgi:hypothetical protein